MAHTRVNPSSSPDIASRVGRALAGSPAEGIVVCRPDETVLFLSEAAARLLGIPTRHAPGARIADLLASSDQPTVQLRFESALLDPGPAEFIVPRPSAADEWLEVRTLPVEGGELAFCLRDVTERERRERELRLKEQRLLAANRSLRLAHKAARAASWEWRIGKSLRWLDLAAAREMVGLPPTWTDDQEIPDWRTLIPPDDRPAFERGLQNLLRDGEASFQFRVRGGQGEEHWLEASAAVSERAPDGSPMRISGVTVNVTQDKHVQEQLRQEIAERRRAQEHQQLLVRELNHRVKNMLATVQSIARQSLRPLKDSRASRDFEDRLMALSWAYEILTRERWAGAGLREVLDRTLAPHAGEDAERISLEGPDVWLGPTQALALAMAAHELATNAVKYGALSTPQGRIAVRWSLDHSAPTPRLDLRWSERGGPRVSGSRRDGFGSKLIQTSLARELGGRAAIDFRPEGVECRISAPLPAAQPSPQGGDA